MRPAASTSALGQVGERAAELGLVREGRTQHIFLSDPAQQEMTGWWHAEAHGNVWESPPYTSLPNCVFSAVTFGAEISCGSGIYTTGISQWLLQARVLLFPFQRAGLSARVPGPHRTSLGSILPWGAVQNVVIRGRVKNQTFLSESVTWHDSVNFSKGHHHHHPVYTSKNI